MLNFNKEETKVIGAMLPISLYHKLHMLAKLYRVSVSAVIREILSEYVDSVINEAALAGEEQYNSLAEQRDELG